MLLAKIKEKLFNRRNTVEIYELIDSAGNPIDVEKVVSDAEASSTIYKVNASVGEIPEELLNIMKVGDFVICSDKIAYQLIEKGDEALTLQGLSEEYISVCKYEISSEHWVVDESYQKPIINPEDAQAGTIVDALGLDEDGKLVKGQAGGGGTKLYLHSVLVGAQGAPTELKFISDSSSQAIKISKYGEYYVCVPDAKIIIDAQAKNTNLERGLSFVTAYLDDTQGKVIVRLTLDLSSTPILKLFSFDDTYSVVDTVTEL